MKKQKILFEYIWLGIGEKRRRRRKYWLIKNAGIKEAITSKREDNQTPTFYIMTESSIDDFITKSQKQGTNAIISKKGISEGFYAIITRSATKYFFGLWQSKKLVSKSIV